MAQLKSSTQTKLDDKADLDANGEVTQLPAGAATALRPKSLLRADGSWGREEYLGVLVMPAGVTQAFADTVPTMIQFDAEDHDITASHSNTTNNTRITVPSSVTKVRLTGQCRFNWATSTGSIRLRILKNGGTFVGQPISYETNSAGGKDGENIITPIITVTAGDYFELEAVQYSGATQYLQDTNTTWFSMEVIK